MQPHQMVRSSSSGASKMSLFTKGSRIPIKTEYVCKNCESPFKQKTYKLFSLFGFFILLSSMYLGGEVKESHKKQDAAVELHEIMSKLENRANGIDHNYKNSPEQNAELIASKIEEKRELADSRNNTLMFFYVIILISLAFIFYCFIFKTKCPNCSSKIGSKLAPKAKRNARKMHRLNISN